MPEHITELPPGVKATTGGTFDRNEPFQFFIASSPEMGETSQLPTVLVAVNELRTRKTRDVLDRMLDSGRRVMLDSGIFNLAMEHARAHDVTHDRALALAPEDIDGFDQLWDDYGTLVTSYGDRLWGCVELDQGGAANKPRTRARIEEEFGIVPIPVYHPLLDGHDYYDTLAVEYDRICFGNLVKASSQLRLRLIHTAYERARLYPYLWTHLLGVYPNQNLLGIGTQMRGSSDASAWLTPIRWMPSWRGWGLLQMLSGYPTTMWAHAGTNDGESDRVTMEKVCAHTTAAAQATLTEYAKELT